MIISFADKETERLFVLGVSRKLPSTIINTALRKLDYLNRAKTLQDLKSPTGNRLEALKGDLKGKYSIRINDQYRIVFKFSFVGAGLKPAPTKLYEVEIRDYH